MTFVASANAVVYTGAEPGLRRRGSEDGNLDPDLLDEAIATLRREGRRVAAVMSVDLLGSAPTTTAIGRSARELEVPLVEDAAEALGPATGAAVGPAGSFGRAAALSFNGNKIMTTSGGGMLLSPTTRRWPITPAS